MKIKVKHVDGIKLPFYATPDSSGVDLRGINLKSVYSTNSDIPLSPELFKNTLENNYFTLRPFERALVGTGLFMEIPKGYEMQIRPKSGNSLKKGIDVKFGTIDAKLN